MRTISQLASEAMKVQNACNPLGVANSYVPALTDLVNALRANGQDASTQAVCDHPINRLWVSKLHDLAGMGLSDVQAYSEAWFECEAIANGKGSN